MNLKSLLAKAFLVTAFGVGVFGIMGVFFSIVYLMLTVPLYWRVIPPDLDTTNFLQLGLLGSGALALVLMVLSAAYYGIRHHTVNLFEAALLLGSIFCFVGVYTGSNGGWWIMYVIPNLNLIFGIGITLYIVNSKGGSIPSG